MKINDFVLSEALNDEQVAEVRKWPRDNKALSHTDHYFGVGNHERVEPLAGTMNKSEVHRKIEQHLGQNIEPMHYKEGHTFDKYNRKVRIGAMLQKTKASESLINDFANDNTRQGKKFTGLTVKTTRSPEGVAGQTSSGQSWENESCKNYESGCNKHYLPHEVKHGTVVSYLHNHEGKEIARATFQPHENDAGHKMYKLNSYYGIHHQGFKDHLEKTEDELSGPHKGGSNVYKIHDKVYNDTRPHTKYHLHPSTSPDEVEKILNEKTVSSDVLEHQIVAAGYKHANAHHIDLGLNSWHHEVRTIAAAHKNASDAQIHKGLDDERVYVRAAAASNPSAKEDHLERGLNDYNATVSAAAAENPNLRGEQLERTVKHNPNPDVRGAAIRHNPNITKELLDHGVKDPEFEVRKAVVYHPKATNEHLKAGLADSNRFVRTTAAQNQALKGDLLKYALNHNDVHVASGAAQNPNLTDSDIDNVLTDERDIVRRMAIFNPNTKEHHLRKLMKDKNIETRAIAKEMLDHRNNR